MQKHTWQLFILLNNLKKNTKQHEQQQSFWSSNKQRRDCACGSSSLHTQMGIQD